MIDELGYSGKRIFEHELTNDGTTLELTEACDLCISCELTKKQVIELANDFMRIADKMKDS